MSSSVPPAAVLGWFDVHRRDLPWREPGRSGWEILVSEIMLQQTPVARVLGPWTEWVQRWPTPSAMAAASPGDVLRAWGKLGYPRRALRLHTCAQVLAAEFGDVVPDDVDTLLSLPGIGDYTARAVACFAYGRAVPVVDTNVRRVIARAAHGRAEPGNPAKRDLDDAEVLLPRAADGSYSVDAPMFSAALMELGALVCTARSPRCDECPLTDCRWVRRGRPAHSGPPRRTQKFAGTDRQVRGLLLDVLRDSNDPVPRGSLDVVWTTDTAQRDRALDSLLSDGLVEITKAGLFCLAGEADIR
ncbi:A/G-specific adenine glycosylase [Gordonia sp. (in: high G+C Gram-positive bacteria)]|uniref:A/G-specific adenine glycosylase n=1 Tax=Gordonia sp. (in: high G+C Gram-positive bacteria) TaxID=84139 RepID=UPI001D797DE9|nr:A/G-specific adenine glycosylase [Gordonia sp. (in: high G+C Gram-positive bacteria)]MCB1294148.1 A/G-specific adenine glycosylase [Gordonia sp. (in: high G+C Gram-positive bacteria)]HMS76663.1 A/G-specific adenine glycosylase [Gordonia sp. (in: high G+C Gram-positive bacteria)]HQV20156.1 A/G-specific adenine glycosylase [Gordonia sp. (in: high G+C Gram-positive bacteria)]